MERKRRKASVDNVRITDENNGELLSSSGTISSSSSDVDAPKSNDNTNNTRVLERRSKLAMYQRNRRRRVSDKVKLVLASRLNSSLASSSTLQISSALVEEIMKDTESEESKLLEKLRDDRKKKSEYERERRRKLAEKVRVCTDSVSDELVMKVTPSSSTSEPSLVASALPSSLPIPPESQLSTSIPSSSISMPSSSSSSSSSSVAEEATTCNVESEESNHLLKLREERKKRSDYERERRRRLAEKLKLGMDSIPDEIKMKIMEDRKRKSAYERERRRIFAEKLKLQPSNVHDMKVIDRRKKEAAYQKERRRIKAEKKNLQSDDADNDINMVENASTRMKKASDTEHLTSVSGDNSSNELSNKLRKQSLNKVDLVETV